MIKIDTSNREKWGKIEEEIALWYEKNSLKKLNRAIEYLVYHNNLIEETSKYLVLLKSLKDQGISLVINRNIDYFINNFDVYSDLFVKVPINPPSKKTKAKINILIDKLEVPCISLDEYKIKIDELKEENPLSQTKIEEAFRDNYNINTEIFFAIYDENIAIGKPTPLDKNQLLKAYTSDLSFLYLDKIFNYEKFVKEKRHKIISMMGENVCPYCQRNYISNYLIEDEEKTTADLDHFYSKSKYPYLALSLYNFIPSCQSCNSRMKGAKDTVGAIYPYTDSFDGKGAKFKSIGLTENLLEFEGTFTIKIDPNNSNDVKKSIEIFNLNKIYENSHNEYILDMLNNIKNKPKSYTHKLEELFKVTEEEEEEEALEVQKKIKSKFEDIVKAPYKFKIEKGEPLGKLTKDILEQWRISI